MQGSVVAAELQHAPRRSEPDITSTVGKGRGNEIDIQSGIGSIEDPKSMSIKARDAILGA